MKEKPAETATKISLKNPECKA